MSVTLEYEPTERPYHIAGMGCNGAVEALEAADAYPVLTEEHLPMLRALAKASGYKEVFHKLIEGVEKYGSITLSKSY